MSPTRLGSRLGWVSVHSFVTLLIWFGCAVPTSAQQANGAIPKGSPLRLRSRTFVPTEGIEAPLAEAIRDANHENVHFILQLTGPVSIDTKEELRRKGIELLLPLREDGWFASAAPSARLDHEAIRYAGLFDPTDKIAPELHRKPYPSRIVNGDGTIAVHLLFHPNVSRELADEKMSLFKQSRTKLHFSRFGKGAYRVSLAADDLVPIASMDSVMWIEPGNPVHEPLNDLSRQATKADAVQDAVIGPGTEIAYDLSGNGVQVAIFDTGVDPAHDDFLGRILRSSTTGTHGTHVGGIIGSSGFLSSTTGGGSLFQFRGMAPGCEIASYDISIDEADYDEAIGTFGTEISNNSFVQSATLNYDTSASVLDGLVRGSNEGVISIVFGTGNNGIIRQFGDLVGYYSAFTSAKNTLAVGATNSDDNIRASFSSMGPTFDGRLKPDVVAPGCNTVTGIFSTIPADNYGYLCGTSMAGPATSGCMALLYEQYQRIYGVNLDFDPPLPSTMKAVLIQTATDLIHENPSPSEDNNPDTGVPVFYHAGPDYATGYGLINVEEAARLIEERRLREFVVRSLRFRRLFFQVPEGLPQLKVTIAWDDLPGNPAEDNTLPKLVNNLDLILRAPNGGGDHLPWVVPAPPHEPYGENMTGIDPITPMDILPATRGVDTVNNVEQVVVNNPPAGRWLLRIQSNPSMADQSFSVASSVALPLVTLDISCEPMANQNGRLNVDVAFTNNLNDELPIRVAFRVRDCNSSVTQFRTFEGKVIKSHKAAVRTVKVRFPESLQRGCDLEFGVKVFHANTGEILAVDTCTFQIPE